MNRRSFFRTAAAGAATAGLGICPAGYTYDWTAIARGGAPETDDPAYRNKRLPRGKRSCRVFLNGIELPDLPVTIIRTGPDGYVTYQKRTAGRPLILNNEVVTETIRGYVEWAPR